MAAFGLAALIFAGSLLVCPEWALSWRTLLSLGAGACVTALDVKSKWRGTTAPKADTPQTEIRSISIGTSIGQPTSASGPATCAGKGTRRRKVDCHLYRKLLPIASLALAALGCALPAISAATPKVIPAESVQTAVAATLTALPPAPGATSVPPAETPVPGATPPASVCSLAYADGTSLYCLGEGAAPMLIATGDGPLSSPAISPDGALVAYTVQLNDGTIRLWVAKADGSGQRLLVGPDQLTSGDPNVVNLPLTYQWRAGTHTLFFDTAYILLTGAGTPGDRSNGDLWQVDADTGTVTVLSGRQTAGRFALSPDGKFAALVLPQAVDLADLASSDVRRLLDYPAIVSGGSYSYLPPITWSPDSAFFSAAIPSSDPFTPGAYVTFYRLGVDGSEQMLGTIAGNYSFGDGGGRLPPEFSPDGQRVFFAHPDDANRATQLYVCSADGSGAAVVAQAPGFSVAALGWSPDSQHYAFSIFPDGGGFVAGLEGDAQPFAPGAQVVSLTWQDASSFYFYGQVGAKWGLYFQRLGEQMQVVADGLGEGVSFDVRR